MKKTKQCRKCRRRRKVKEFFRCSRAKDGLSYECKDCNRERFRSWHARNGGDWPAKQSQRRARLKVLTHYSKCDVPECACCGERRIEFMAIDHINGGGAKHRKEIGRRSITSWLAKNKFPPGFRVLCHNCNTSYGHYGYCPHQPESERKSPAWFAPELIPLTAKKEARIQSLVASAQELIDDGFYPGLNALVKIRTTPPRHVSGISVLRAEAARQGRWPCEIAARGRLR